MVLAVAALILTPVALAGSQIQLDIDKDSAYTLDNKKLAKQNPQQTRWSQMWRSRSTDTASLYCTPSPTRWQTPSSAQRTFFSILAASHALASLELTTLR